MHSISLKDSQCTSLLDSVHLGDLNHYKDVICAGQNPGPHYFMPKVNNDLSKFNKIKNTVRPLVRRFLGPRKISAAKKSVYTLKVLLTSPYADLQISVGRG